MEIVRVNPEDAADLKTWKITTIMEQDLNKLRYRAYSTAKAHGFHEKEQSDETYLMSIISEIGEAVNADRKGHYAEIEKFDEWKKSWNKEIKEQPYSDNYTESNFKDHFDFYIEGSVECELADVAICLLDFAGARKVKIGDIYPNIDLDRDKSFVENCFELTWILLSSYINEFAFTSDWINSAISLIFMFADFYSIDLYRFIDLKMRYNELRTYKNGKETIK